MVVATVLGAAAPGCAAGKCDQELVDRATKFMADHQSCAVDADCVVVSDYCEVLPKGYCGQLSMSRAGKDSAEWAAIDQELKDCSPSNCDVCGAGLIPTCRNGSCTGPG